MCRYVWIMAQLAIVYGVNLFGLEYNILFMQSSNQKSLLQTSCCLLVIAMTRIKSLTLVYSLNLVIATRRVFVVTNMYKSLCCLKRLVINVAIE